ncbi:50S ribosomal protein L25/general stress protein Ctc [soil metagenome]
MKTFEIKGTRRSSITKQEVKSLRNSGKVPCVLYGGDEQIHFSAETANFKGLIYTPEVYMVKIYVDGTEYMATLQDVQFHPVNDAINHVDFLQVFKDKPVTMSIPVRTTGASEGVKMGGKLVLKARRLKIRGISSTLPDAINVDISGLKIGNTIRVKDLKIDGVEIMDSPSNVIVSVNMTRNVAADAVAEKGK